MNANRIYNELINVLSDAGYDISKVKFEHRIPNSSTSYYAITILDQSCINIRGIKIEYIEIPPRYIKLFNKYGLQLEFIKSKDWARLPANGFSFINYKDLAIEIFEDCLSSEGFDCCSRYMQCSDAKNCVHPDLLFAGQCRYRQKLKQGIIFYGKNRNVD